ncbi:hypothetical protein H0H92_002215 [Tricholoma furcatifolium]|nr:hypothetical protein H0H92_002215 [Tricholoma furcatifolium]
MQKDFYRHTSPRYAPYPPPKQSMDDDEIGSSDSSSQSDDYRSDTDKSYDQLNDDDAQKSGFGFSAATWSSSANRGNIHDRKRKDRNPPRPHYPPTRTYSSSSAHHPIHYPSRRSLSPEPYQPSSSAAQYRRPVSPEPLYREYQEYRDRETRQYRDRKWDRDRDWDRGRDEWERERGRERLLRTSRSSQTSPTRVEPIHPTGPRTYIRMLTPTRYRSGAGSPISDQSDRDRERQDREHQRLLEREREEIEEREREREREKHREMQRAKYQYESRVPPPPPSLSAPLTLRPPPPHHHHERTLSLSNTRRAVSNGGFASNAHYAPPRIVLPARGGRARDEDDYDLGEDEVISDEDRMAPGPSSMRSRYGKARMGGPSTSTFVLSGGGSTPTNNNGMTSTTTTFHITTPRAISASLAAAQHAASHPNSAAAVEAEKAEAEKMRIPSFKRGGKTRYQCIYCSKDFSRKNDAYRHMSRKHNDNATEFICVCGRVLSRGDALTRHMRTCRESKEKGATASGGALLARLQKKPPKKMRVGTVVVTSMVDPEGEDESMAGDEQDNDVSMEEEES